MGNGWSEAGHLFSRVVGFSEQQTKPQVDPFGCPLQPFVCRREFGRTANSLLPFPTSLHLYFKTSRPTAPLHRRSYQLGKTKLSEAKSRTAGRETN